MQPTNVPTAVSALVAAKTPPIELAPRRPRGRPRKRADELDDGNRRQELIAAAAGLFRRQGFEATTTRDIAAAAGMQSGSPFYHFKSKAELLHAVMDSGMRTALARQEAVLHALDPQGQASAWRQLQALVCNHFSVLLGPGSDFIPVMLYERRSLRPAQSEALNALKARYEARWVPVLEALHAQGRLRAPVPLARLLMFGALNWTVQWYDAHRNGASIDALTDATLKLFVGPFADPED